MKAFIPCVLLLAATGSHALAQETPLRPGDRVRITGSAAGEYDVRQVGGSMLTVTDSTGKSVDVLLSSIDRLDVSRGPRTAWGGAKRGAAIGLGIGVGAGILIGLADGDDPPEAFIRFTAAEKAAALSLVFGGSAAILGGLIGASAPGERWERVRLDGPSDGPRVGLTRDGAVAIGYVARF